SRRFGGSASGGKGARPPSLESSRCLTGSTALMVMGDVKMASELLAEAPLASAEEDFSDFNSNKLSVPHTDSYCRSDSGAGGPSAGHNGDWMTMSNRTTTADAPADNYNGGGVDDVCLDFGEPNLGAFSASLEDLVSSFDEKITKCLRDYDQTTEQLAPVQVRSQEEIMKTDQCVNQGHPSVVDDSSRDFIQPNCSFLLFTFCELFERLRFDVVNQRWTCSLYDLSQLSATSVSREAAVRVPSV
ncbi:fasciculation and elongation protein zeta-2-like, partial [Tropilaelaps mercedesae]